MSQPYDPYAGLLPGHAPPPRRRSRAVVWWTVGGSLVAAALLVLVTVAGYRMGSSGLLDLPDPATTSPPADWAVIGDDEGLDPYAQRCHDGEMRACDELYHLSEPGSDYEYYALTCGGRVDARAVSTCVLLG